MPKTENIQRRRFSAEEAKVGERVYVKREPVHITGLSNKQGTIIDLQGTSGIRIRFDKPIKIQYLGWSGPQTVETFNLSSSCLGYL